MDFAKKVQIILGNFNFCHLSIHNSCLLFLTFLRESDKTEMSQEKENLKRVIQEAEELKLFEADEKNMWKKEEVMQLFVSLLMSKDPILLNTSILFSNSP